MCFSFHLFRQDYKICSPTQIPTLLLFEQSCRVWNWFWDVRINMYWSCFFRCFPRHREAFKQDKSTIKQHQPTHPRHPLHPWDPGPRCSQPRFKLGTMHYEGDQVKLDKDRQISEAGRPTNLKGSTLVLFMGNTGDGRIRIYIYIMIYGLLSHTKYTGL